MESLLPALKTAIAAGLTYLRAVEVIEREDFMPEEPGFPIVCLIDGGLEALSMPGKKDIEILSVGVVAYQEIALDEPGASIMGSTAQLGNQGKGVLAIGLDLKSLLNDNFLGQAKIHYAHLDRHRPAQPFEGQRGFIISKRYDFSYRRYV